MTDSILTAEERLKNIEIMVAENPRFVLLSIEDVLFLLSRWRSAHGSEQEGPI